MKPYIILHPRWRPKRYRASYIGPRLAKLAASKGLAPLVDPVHGPQVTSLWCDEKLHAEVRRNTPEAGQGEGWHRDGDLKPGSRMDHAAVLWCNECPTEFKFNGVVYQPKPFEVVLARNISHRRPPTAPAKRWLYRQRVEIPTHLELP